MVGEGVRLKKVMKRVWAEALPDVPYRADATWDEIGIDSLKAFEVVLRLERALGARLPLELFTLDNTPADVVRILVQHAPAPEPPKGTPAFLVPGLWGSVPLLAKLTQGFEGQLAFHICKIPGLETPARTLGDVGGLAESVVREIQARQPEGEIGIVGYSTGGMIACEAASRLERLGRRVSGLCILDSPLPGRVENFAPWLLETMLPILLRSSSRARKTAALRLLGGPAERSGLPRDVESFLFLFYLRLGLLEPARRLLLAGRDRRSAEWTSACRRRLIVRLSLRGALAWSPPPCRAPMLLVAADQVQGLGQVERWREAYPQIEVVEVRAAHAKMFEPAKLARFKPALLRLLQAAPTDTETTS